MSGRFSSLFWRERHFYSAYMERVLRMLMSLAIMRGKRTIEKLQITFLSQEIFNFSDFEKNYRTCKPPSHENILVLFWKKTLMLLVSQIACLCKLFFGLLLNVFWKLVARLDTVTSSISKIEISKYFIPRVLKDLNWFQRF